MNPSSSEVTTLAALASILIITTCVQAQTIANGDFQLPDGTGLNNGGSSAITPTGWSFSNPGGGTGTNSFGIRDNGPLTDATRDQFFFMNQDSVGNGAILFQMTSEVIVEGFTYTLTVDVGEQNNQPDNDLARIGFYGSTIGTGGSFSELTNIDPDPTNTTATWGTFQTSFTADATQAGQTLGVYLGFGAQTGEPNSLNASFDNVGVTVSTEPPSLALLHHWKLDETSGQTAVDSAGSADGTLGSTTGVDASDPAVNQPGVFGTAFEFNDAENDRVTISDISAVSGLTSGSVTGWFKTSAVSPGFRGVLFRFGDAGSNDRLILEMRDDGTLYLILRNNDSNSIQLATTAAFDDDEWHHFAITQDGAAAKLYLDGAELTGGALSSSVTSGDWLAVLADTANTMSIGWESRASASGGVPFGGLIDDVAVFDGALDGTQISDIIDQGAENFDSDTTAPSITGLDPDGASGIYPGSSLTATFSEDIVLTGGGTITITDADDGTGTQTINLPDASQVTVSGRDLIIDPASNLEFGANFEVVISAGAIEDDASPPNAFDGTTSGQWTFSTAAQDFTAPMIVTQTPGDNAIDVPPGTSIVAAFDDNIIAGSGDIVLKDLTDGSTTQTVAVTDSSQVTISGNLLTINPTTLLATETDYAVQIDGGAVLNYSDLPFAGIPGTDETTWNFLTKSQSPNVIFILGDDQAWYDYSFMYRPSVEKAAIDLDPSIPQVAQTPGIDRLADEGLAFVHGYSAPICRPSLTSIITGTYPHQSLVTGNDPASGPDTAVEARMQVLNPLPRTLANELGYTSFQTGKWWEADHTNGGFTQGDTANSTALSSAPSQWSGGRPGYVSARHGDWGLMAGRVDYVNTVTNPEHWDDVNEVRINYANTVVTVTDFIDTQVAAEQPFFLWYAPFLPHTPHDPPAKLLAKYNAMGLSSADAKYYANIERFDGGVEAILDHLDSTGITDNTIVMLICDNGRQYDLATIGKLTPYETGARTPIIVRWPDRIKPGGEIEPQIIRTPVNQVDMVTTIHHALGLSTFPEMRGIDLLDPSAVASRNTISGENYQHDMLAFPDPWPSLTSRFATRDGWKLIRFTNGTTELYQLYDTTTGAPIDPHETNNIAASHPDLVSELSVAIANQYAVDPNDFDSWISDPVLGIAVSEQGFNHDPDGDNLDSGVEAWFGTHPGEFSTGLTNLATDGTTSTFTHPQNLNPPGDLSGTYQWSPNLVDWYAGDGVDGPGGGTTVNILANTVGTITTVTATASAPAERLFLRARVSQN